MCLPSGCATLCDWALAAALAAWRCGYECLTYDGILERKYNRTLRRKLTDELVVYVLLHKDARAGNAALAVVVEEPQIRSGDGLSPYKAYIPIG